MRRTHDNEGTARHTTGTRVRRFVRRHPGAGGRSAIERACDAELQLIADRFTSS